jgi:hypothetical protein
MVEEEMKTLGPTTNGHLTSTADVQEASLTASLHERILISGGIQTSLPVNDK